MNRNWRTLTTLKCGSKDEGEWNEETNLRDVKDFLIKPDGALIEGHWKNDKINGRTRCIRANFDVYKRYWKDNMAHRYGKYFYSNGDLDEGYWKDDAPHGKGKKIY